MDKYKKKIKSNIITGGIMITIILGLCIFDLLIGLELISFHPQNSMILSFQTGFLLGIGAVALVMLVRNAKVLKDPTKLQILYNKEHDERLIYIEQKAGMPMIAITSGAMAVAGIIAGYFNLIVFYTLIAAALVQIIISIIVKSYYTKAM